MGNADCCGYFKSEMSQVYLAEKADQVCIVRKKYNSESQYEESDQWCSTISSMVEHLTDADIMTST